MSLFILPIMALIFTTLPDKIFKNYLQIVGTTLVIADGDVAANEKVKKNSSNLENAFESDLEA
jgi:hypothetical protein